jgi:hypothetical protein
MGIPFPLNDDDDLARMSQPKRDVLKAAIRALFQYDPEVKKMLEDGTKLDEVRKLLRGKTKGLFKKG